jgi:hypothetical protein
MSGTVKSTVEQSGTAQISDMNTNRFDPDTATVCEPRRDSETARDPADTLKVKSNLMAFFHSRSDPRLQRSHWEGP